MDAVSKGRWARAKVPVLLLAGVIGLVLPVSNVVRVPAAAVLAYGLFRIGYVMIRGLAMPIPTPPPAGELRRVKLVYRCSSCGAEVRMTHAATEDPDPPRHCMDEMDLIKTADDFL